MFMTLRAEKCSRLSSSRAGQSMFTQRWSASPSVRFTALPQTGQWSGKRNSRRGELSPSGGGMTSTTLGMTSPPRSTSTWSPILRPSRAISSALCSVARPTVVPPINTGVSTATGVSLPVRPTWILMSSTRVIPERAVNL